MRIQMKHDYDWLEEAEARIRLERRQEITADELVRSQKAMIVTAAQNKKKLNVTAKAIKNKTEVDHLKESTIQRRITAVYGPWKALISLHSMSFSDDNFGGNAI